MKFFERHATRLWTYGLGALIALLPFSLELRLADPVTSKALRFIKLPFADAAIWLLVGLLVLTRPWRGDRLRRALATPGVGAPVLAAAIAILATLPWLGAGASATDCLQRLDHFVLAYAFALFAPRDAVRRALGPLLDPLIGLFVAVAAIQTFILGELPFRVTSLFEDRHLFGAWLAIALAVRIGSRPVGRARLAFHAAVAVLAVATTTTILPLVGVGLGVLAGGVGRPRRRIPAIALPLAVVALVFMLITPGAHRARILDEWRVRDVATVDELRERGGEIDSLKMIRLGLLTLDLGTRILELHTPNWHPNLTVPPDRRREEIFEPSYVRQRYLEWQAALYALARNPVLGTGLGSYQAQTSLSYLSFKKLKTLEPNTQSSYAVEVVGTGLAGLAALLWMLIHGIGRAVARDRAAARSVPVLPGAAVAAGLVAAAIAAIAVPVLQSSLAILPVMLIAVVDRRDDDDVERSFE